MIKNEFVVLHRDDAFPAEEKLLHYFTSNISDDLTHEWMINLDLPFDEHDYWSHLEIERTDDDGSLLTRIRVDAVRKRNYPQRFLYSELVADDFVRQLERNGFPPAKGEDNWCFTSLSIESDDPRERKDFVRIVERFMSDCSGRVIYPEMMSLAEFRSFYSLVADKVEEESEPSDED